MDDMGFLCVIPNGILCILSNSTYMFFSHCHLFIYTNPGIYYIFFFFLTPAYQYVLEMVPNQYRKSFLILYHGHIVFLCKHHVPQLS